MKILITGGTGLIGSFLAKSLTDQGHGVVIYHRRDALPQHLQGHSSNIQSIQGDLFDLHKVTEAIQECDAVIHAAGHVSFAPRDKRIMQRINVEATRLWVDVALHCDVKRFVFISSVSAMGLPKDQNLIDESVQWEEGASHTEYGRTKHMGEREVWRGIEEGLPGVIVNPSVVISPGAEVRSSLRMLQYVKKGGRFIFPGQVNYIDIRDLTQLLTILLTKELISQQYIASAGSLSYADFLQQIAHTIGSQPPSIRLPLGLLRNLAPLEELRNYVLGGNPLVTRDMVKSLQKEVTYDGSKATLIPGFTYRPLDDSLRWVINEMWGTNESKV